MASTSAGAQPGNVIFGTFVPQGWKMELAGIAGPQAKWAKAVEVAAGRGAGLRLALGLRPLPQRARAGARDDVRGWTTLAAISQRTSRIRLGQMVGCPRTATRGCWPRSPPTST